MWVGFDIETSGDKPEYALQPWRGQDGSGWIRTAVEVSATRERRIINDGTEAIACELQELVDYWVENSVTVCAWHAAFEIAWLANYVDHYQLRRIKWLDGMLLWRHCDNAPEYDTVSNKRKSYNLKAAVAEFLPAHAGYEEGIDFHGEDLEKLLEYNAKDSRYTRALTYYFYLRLAEEPARLRAAMIESRCLAEIGLANYHGIEIDHSAMRDLDKSLAMRQSTLGESLNELGATDKVLASPLQLRALLFDDWGLTPIKHGKTGASTDKETLHELSLIDDRVAAIREYREVKNNRTKFVKNLISATGYNNTGNAHPQARLFGTYSGRVTYSSSQGAGKNKCQTGWAIHQMKRDTQFRSLIKAPMGHTIVEFDAAGQEFRWMAVLSRDETMLQMCLPGEDAHAYMGHRIGGATYDEVKQGAKADDPQLKRMRHLGKLGNLSCQYRVSAKKLQSIARVQYGMEMDLATAEHIHRTYQQTYPGVPRYWQQQIRFIKTYHYVDTLAGRRVYVDRKTIAKSGWSAESTSINYPIQGTGADQKCLGISLIRLILHRYHARFLFDLHDGLFFVVPTEFVTDFVAHGKSILDDLPYQVWGHGVHNNVFLHQHKLVDLSIPMPFDAKYGTNWGNIHD